ncbi:MAG: DUF4340 domain-containing protein [Gemmataceae bacterium]|nr:DUF4340 domain-containing protein [Gemmataceae bacterium]
MNFRLTATLAAAGLVLVAVLLFFTFLSQEESASSEGLLLSTLAGVKPEEIDTVEIERENQSTITFRRVDNQRWTMEWEGRDASGQKVPLKASADGFVVNDIVRELLSARPIRHHDLTVNPALHGLQPAGLKVTLRKGDSLSATVEIGDVTSGGRAAAFVLVPPRKHPLAVNRSVVDPLLADTTKSGRAADLAKTEADFRNKSIFPVESFRAEDETTRLHLELVNQKKTLSLEKSSGGWQFQVPSGWGAADVQGDSQSPPGTFTGVRPLLNALTSLRAGSKTDFIDLPTPEQLQQHGLNPEAPDLVRVQLTTKNNETTTVYIGKADVPEKKDNKPEATPLPSSDDKRWVRVEGQPGIIRVGGANVSGLIGLIRDPDPLRDRNLLTVERNRIEGLDLSTGVILRRVGSPPEWKLFGPPTPNEPQAVNNNAVQSMLDLLTERRIVRSFPPANDAHFSGTALQLEIKIWVDAFQSTSDAKTEPKLKENAKPIILKIGSKEGDAIYVRRILADGSSNDYLLPEKVKVTTAGSNPVDVLATLRKSRLDLLDPSLKTFGTDAVAKLTVSGAVSYELTRSEKPDTSTGKHHWTFAAPESRKGQLADTETVEELLRLLGTTQSVSRYINETPTEEQLKEYGLAPQPQLKVVVHLQSGDDKERVYEFGKATADAGYVYARQGGKAIVFTVPKLLFDRFVTADLRDKSLLLFDASQVVGVQLKGWGKAGFLTELHFQKDKQGNWSVQSPPTPAGYNLDAAKLTAFVELLSKTKVRSFVDGAAKPEYGLDNDKEYLIVTLKFTDGTERVLKLGAAADGGAAVYAWTSLGGGQLLTLDASPFKPYKESPGSLAR